VGADTAFRYNRRMAELNAFGKGILFLCCASVVLGCTSTKTPDGGSGATSPEVTRGSSSPTSSAGSTDSFYSAIFADRNFNSIDGTNISDDTLLAGGKEFCSRLTDTRSQSKDSFAQHPIPEDFNQIAESLARTRFAAAKGITGSDANAQIVASMSVGIAAVNNLCPQFKSALG